MGSPDPLPDSFSGGEMAYRSQFRPYSLRGSTRISEAGPAHTPAPLAFLETGRARSSSISPSLAAVPC